MRVHRYSVNDLERIWVPQVIEGDQGTGGALRALRCARAVLGEFGCRDWHAVSPTAVTSQEGLRAAVPAHTAVVGNSKTLREHVGVL